MNSLRHKNSVYPMARDKTESCVLEEENVNQYRKRCHSASHESPKIDVDEISKIKESMEFKDITIMKNVYVVIKKLKTHEIPNINNDVVSVINETLEVGESPNIDEISAVKEFPILKDVYVVIKKLKAHEIPNINNNNDDDGVSVSNKAIKVVPMRAIPCSVVLQDIKHKLSA